MLLLTATTDKLQVTSSSTSALDVHCTFMDMSQDSPPVVQGDTSGRQNTAITTATTTDVLAAPGASTTRNAKTINIRNKGAADNTVTVIFDQNGTDFELHKATLSSGEALEYVEGVGWFVMEDVARLEVELVVTADVTNATTSWADITGLSYPVLAGKTYTVECFFMYICNATTTGARFGFNGPAATYFRTSGIGTVTGSVTAAAMSSPVAAVTAYDNSSIGAQTTGPASEVAAWVGACVVPSADGTLAARCQSEVAVASGLIVRRGSWMKLKEAHNA